MTHEHINKELFDNNKHFAISLNLSRNLKQKNSKNSRIFLKKCKRKGKVKKRKRNLFKNVLKVNSSLNLEKLG